MHTHKSQNAQFTTSTNWDLVDLHLRYCSSVTFQWKLESSRSQTVSDIPLSIPLMPRYALEISSKPMQTARICILHTLYSIIISMDYNLFCVCMQNRSECENSCVLTNSMEQ